MTSYDSWHQTVHAGDDPSVANLDSWHLNALSLAKPSACQDVVEVGCGVGDFAITLSRTARSVRAIDISATAIEMASRKAIAQGSSAAFLVGSAESLPLPNACCDLLYSCECLEHVPHPRRALEEMMRVLRPGGRLVLTTENYCNPLAFYWFLCLLRGVRFNSGDYIQPIEHFFLFWQVAKMIRKTGIVDLQMLGSHHIFLLLPRLHPHTFVVERFSNHVLARFFRPLARHMAFSGIKPR